MRVLIANRGEIAVRIARACRELGYDVLVAYSDADRGSKAVTMADSAFCIGAAPASSSYLNTGAILTAAHAMGADAVHPGYGFLSENAGFARDCAEHGLVFIGPSAEAIDLMGDKISARNVAESSDVPVLPAAEFASLDDSTLAQTLGRVGVPAIVKAAAGGGGRGMRRVDRAPDLPDAVGLARSEAAAAFGDDRVYIERLVERARHVEVQVFGLGEGRAVILGERDCSVQRRHQKLVEESRYELLDEHLRAGMYASARRLAEQIDYLGAGTVEFLYDIDRSEYYFLEMNTRLQVEHGVTEFALDVDLVRQQLLLAATGMCELVDDPAPPATTHVIECRLLAEDPLTGMPSPGAVREFHPPGGPGVRVDTHLFGGAAVPPYYDSMIAKLLVRAPDRENAIQRMRRALRETIVEGISTNLSTLVDVMDSPVFQENKHTTSWFDDDFRNKETQR